MKLLWSPRSPFARKVMILIAEKGLSDDIKLVNSLVMMAAPANPDVLAYNPLCKIPVLILENRTSLFDSRVICEYLDQIGNSTPLIPSLLNERIESLRLQSLSDGLIDVLLLWRTEVGRGSSANSVMCEGFNSKVIACMAQLESEVSTFSNQPFNLGHIAVICVLGQLDFRYPNCMWRSAHPMLAAWYSEISKRPSVQDTMIKDDGAAAMGTIDMPLQFIPSAEEI